MKDREGNLQLEEDNNENLPENKENDRYSFKQFLNDLRMEQQETM